ncbi:MAG TPA: peptidoglycan DD-metalloendopeptidase family protein [Actinomycetota bacterium]|nr:peptidoglycan DD-metalloendopeptidase family protein [Actinomycetota bacterium]
MRGGLRLGLVSVLVAFAMLSNLLPAFSIVCEASPALRFSAPVNGRITKKFVPPLGPYGPGHRGIDFGVSIGTLVRAAGDGVVTFAGPVGRDGLFITLRHDPALETTYSFLSEVSVQRGQRVTRGNVVGVSGAGHPGDAPSLHFGARLNGQYIDPELLLFGDPKDISDVLALAPFPNESGGGGSAGNAGGSGSIGGARGGGVSPVASIASAALVPFEKIGEVLIAAPGAIKNFLLGIGGWLKELPGKIASGAVAAFSAFRTGLIRAFNAIKSFDHLFMSFIKATKRLVLSVWALTKLALNSIAGWLKRLPRNAAAFARLIAQRVREAAAAHWKLLKTLFRVSVQLARRLPGAVRRIAIGLLTTAQQTVKTIASGTMSLLRSVLDGTRDIARISWTALKAGTARLVAAAKTFLSRVWVGARKGAVEAWNFAKSVAVGGWRLAKTVLSAAWRVGKSVAVNAWRVGKATAIAIAKRVSIGLREVWRGAQLAIQAVAQIGQQILRELIKGLRQVAVFFARATRPLTTWLARVTNSGGRILKALGDLIQPFVVTPFVIAHAAVKQLKCEIKGGAQAPLLGGPSPSGRRRPPRPPNDHIVVAVAGIGSSTELRNGQVKGNASMYEFDFVSLGYGRDQTYFYSYKGLAKGSGDGKSRMHAPYGKKDTYQPIEESARLLSLQIDEIRRRNPGKKIDIVAHSQGGVVAQYYITRMYRKQKTDETFLGNFVSISSPHLGADSARLGADIRSTWNGRLVAPGVDQITDRFGLPPPGAPSAMQLAEDSLFMRRLNRDWDPSKVKTTTIAATYDYVVTSPHTRLRGASHYTADLKGIRAGFKSHGSVVDALSTRQFIYNTLKGTPSKCTGFSDVMADKGPGQVISGVQDLMLGTNSLGMLLPAVPP